MWENSLKRNDEISLRIFGQYLGSYGEKQQAKVMSVSNEMSQHRHCQTVSNRVVLHDLTDALTFVHAVKDVKVQCKSDLVDCGNKVRKEKDCLRFTRFTVMPE
jgi:replicative DNA helicase